MDKVDSLQTLCVMCPIEQLDACVRTRGYHMQLLDQIQCHASDLTFLPPQPQPTLRFMHPVSPETPPPLVTQVAATAASVAVLDIGGAVGVLQHCRLYRHSPARRCDVG